ncbi:MAG TPA: DedA family protein [Deltaproteobacteria bacterium]|nr:DedA family protein [Deltaproteobacteria bacterium]
MELIIEWLVAVIGRLGYLGIIALMFLESSFFPFPSEVVVPPAGLLAARGEMSLALVIACGIIGSLLGALFNYALALWLGRPLLIRYGRFFFFPRERFQKVDQFFIDHGEISTFTCRLIPGIRQYISFPAGLARMPLFKFCLYTALGAGIWVVILAYIGFFVGNNMDLVRQYSHQASLGMLLLIAAGVFVYIRRWSRKRTGSVHSLPHGENE